MPLLLEIIGKNDRTGLDHMEYGLDLFDQGKFKYASFKYFMPRIIEPVFKYTPPKKASASGSVEPSPYFIVAARYILCIRYEDNAIDDPNF